MATSSIPEKERCRFLLIEDDDGHALMIRLALENETCSLERLSTGEEAIEHFENPESEKPDVILLDLRLPGLDGFDVLETIRANRAYDRTPVVVLTTSDSESDHSRAKLLGANSYVVKPVGFDAFCSAISDLRDYWASTHFRPRREPQAVTC